MAWTVVENATSPESPRLSAPPPLPTTIGRYRVVALIGSGGMGDVYRARDPELDRDVAVKTVRVAIKGRSDASRERALREAQAMARLSHPNVVEVYDVGIDHGVLFIAMQLIDGPTLATWRGRDWRDTISVYLAAGEALAAAHDEGLVHRDFKPTNVMIDASGVVKVLDFGLARLATESSSAHEQEPASALDVALTATGTVLGTPAYMAPETHVGSRVDARADQFSFCVALWEALFGDRPYRGTNLHELRRVVMRGEIETPPRNIVPTAIVAVLRRGLRVDANDRYDDMPRLLAALRRASRPSRIPIAIGIGVLAAGFAIWLAAAPEDDRCGDPSQALGATWDESRQQATEAAILGSGRAHASSTWEHLRPRLDAWATEWTTSYATICRATNVDRTQSPALLDVRMACLERARDRIDAFLTVLGEGGERAVRGAIAAAARLSSPQACVDASDAGEEVSDENRTRVAEGQRRLAIATARRHAGEYETALDITREVRAVAQEVDDQALVIDATFEYSEAKRALGDLQAAEQSLHDAFLTASGADDPIRATDAAVGLLFMVAIDFGRREESLQWYRHARAQLDRLPEPNLEIEAKLLSTLGAVQGEMGHLEASTASELLALELERQALGSDDVRLVPTLANATAALINESRYAEALALAEDAVAISERNLGADHPDVTKALGVLARAASAGGQHQRAKQAAARAVSIMTMNYGEDHVLTTHAIAALGIAHAAADEHEEALELYRRAAAILSAQLGEDHLELAELHERASESLRKLGRLAEATDELRASMSIAQRSVGADHPELAFSFGRLADLSRQAGDLEQAIAAYRRALELQPPSPERPRKSRSVLLHGLAETSYEAGRMQDADEAYANAIAETRVTPGPTSALHLDSVSGRIVTLLALGRATEARTLGASTIGALEPPVDGETATAQTILLQRTTEAALAERSIRPVRGRR